MKLPKTKFKIVCAVMVALITGTVMPFRGAAVDKVSMEEVIVKHLEAIGEADTRASITSRIITGTVTAAYHAPRIATFEGKAIMASTENKSFIGLQFENSGYAQEKFAYDGQDVTIGLMNPGERSNLGDFLLTHKDIVRFGMLGGILSSAWPLLNAADPKFKLSYAGTKKINGAPAIEVTLMPKKGSDIQVSIFLDQETYRHIRTEYTRVITAGLGANKDASGSQRPTRYRLVEDFSDFSKEGGLMFPHTYKISFSLDTMAGTGSADWTIKLNQFSFNQKIPPSTFKVQ